MYIYCDILYVYITYIQIICNIYIQIIYTYTYNIPYKLYNIPYIKSNNTTVNQVIKLVQSNMHFLYCI